MFISPRLLRDIAESLPGGQPIWSARDMDRQDRILATARIAMARYGRAGLSIGGLARAVRLPPSIIRHYFIDADTILCEILRRHLVTLSAALRAVPADTPDRKTAMGARYLECTRHFGAPTEAHLLLIRDRHTLPEDILMSIEQFRRVVGEQLAGPNGLAVLALLDEGTPQPGLAEILATLPSPATPNERHAEPSAQSPSARRLSAQAEQPPAHRPSPPHHPRPQPAPRRLSVDHAEAIIARFADMRPEGRALLATTSITTPSPVTLPFAPPQAPRLPHLERPP